MSIDTKSVSKVDLNTLKEKVKSLVGSLITISYIVKKKKKLLVTKKALLTNASDNIFCVDVDSFGYTQSLSFTYAEVATGQVAIQEVL